AVGTEAREMLGRTPPNITPVWPVRNGAQTGAASIHSTCSPSSWGSSLSASSSRPTRGPSHGSRALQHVEDFRVHHVDGVTCRVGGDLIEDVGKLDLVLFPRHISDVRRANNVVHCEQAVIRVA